MKTLLIVFGLLVSFRAWSYELGEIVDQKDHKFIKFFRGDTDIAVGEQLRVFTPSTLAYVKVATVEGEFATAEVGVVLVRSGGIYTMDPVPIGGKVFLQLDRKDQIWMEFNLGANSFQRVGDYKGTNWFVGLDVGGYFGENYLWAILLQADSYGKDHLGTEIRRSAYMFGLGKEIDGWQGLLYFGSIDTMTIPGGAAVVHHDDFGGMASLSYRFDLKVADRKSLYGWSIAPRLSYARTFAFNSYGGYFSGGVSITWWVPKFL